MPLRKTKFLIFLLVCKVADDYESLTSPMIYRRAMKPLDGLTIITRDMRGTFDPKILRIFFSVYLNPLPAPKQSIDNNSITEKSTKNGVILLSLSMVFQPKNLY